MGPHRELGPATGMTPTPRANRQGISRAQTPTGSAPASKRRPKWSGAVAVGLLLTTAACGDDDGDSTVASTMATPTTTTEPLSTMATAATTTAPPTTMATPSTTTAPPSLADIQDIEEAGALVISTSGNADWVTVAGDSAWLANVGTGITRYDLATGDMLGEIPMTNDICLAMDEGFGSLWAATAWTTRSCASTWAQG